MPTIEPVGVSEVDPTSRVCDRSATASILSVAATRRSSATITSQPAAPIEFVGAGSPRVNRRSLTTGPAFCDSPV